MSLEVLLIPAAMAAYAAWQARADAGEHNCLVETRWRHAGLLAQALEDIEAKRISAPSTTISATIEGIATTFVCGSDGIMTAHFPRDMSVDEAIAIVNKVDSAYTRRVQDAVYRRVRQRVRELGYELDSETVDADDTITLVVNVS
jgi:hypothetical protein